MAVTREEVEAPESRGQRFRVLCASVEPGLRRALVAAYGPDAGSDAAAEALSWAWEHLERVEAMDNPGGYLWRVGRTAARRTGQQARWASNDAEPVHDLGDPVFEPGLLAAVESLSERQRAAVLLVHGYGYSLAEAALQLGCRIRTLRNHLDRGMAKLRSQLGVTDAD